MLNAVFNVSTAILFMPILQPFTRWVQKLIPSGAKDSQELAIEHIQIEDQNDDVRIDDEMLIARGDITQLLQLTLTYVGYTRGIDYADTTHELKSFDNNKHKAYYEDIKEMGNKLLTFHFDYQEKSITSAEDRQLLHDNQQAIISCLAAAKSTKSIRDNIHGFRFSKQADVQSVYDLVYSNTREFIEHTDSIIDVNHQESTLDQLVESVDAIKHYYDDFIHQASHLEIDGSDSVSLSSLINIAREHYETTKALTDTIDHLYLDDDQSKIFSFLQEQPESTA